MHRYQASSRITPIFGVLFHVLFFFGVSLSATATFAQTPAEIEEARAYYELAITQAEQGRFEEAIASFEAAYRLSERPGLLYNLYLVYQDAGRRDEAADVLRRYLELSPAELEDRAALESRLRVLEGELVEAERVEAERVAAEERAAALQASLEYEEPNHALAWSFIGAGGAIAGGGLLTGLLAANVESDLEANCDLTRTCPPTEQGAIERRDRLAMMTDILLATGLTIAATGVVLRLVRGRGEQPRAAHAARVACSTTGCLAQAQFRF